MIIISNINWIMKADCGGDLVILIYIDDLTAAMLPGNTEQQPHFTDPATRQL